MTSEGRLGGEAACLLGFVLLRVQQLSWCRPDALEGGSGRFISNFLSNFKDACLTPPRFFLYYLSKEASCSVLIFRFFKVEPWIQK